MAGAIAARHLLRATNSESSLISVVSSTPSSSFTTLCIGEGFHRRRMEAAWPAPSAAPTAAMGHERRSRTHLPGLNGSVAGQTHRKPRHGAGYSRGGFSVVLIQPLGGPSPLPGLAGSHPTISPPARRLEPTGSDR